MEKIRITSDDPVSRYFGNDSGLSAFSNAPEPWQKFASKEKPLDTESIRKAPMGSREADHILKISTKINDTLIAPSGHIWRIANIDGEDCIVMDDDATEDEKAVDELSKGN